MIDSFNAIGWGFFIPRHWYWLETLSAPILYYRHFVQWAIKIVLIAGFITENISLRYEGEWTITSDSLNKHVVCQHFISSPNQSAITYQANGCHLSPPPQTQQRLYHNFSLSFIRALCSLSGRSELTDSHMKVKEDWQVSGFLPN